MGFGSNPNETAFARAFGDGAVDSAGPLSVDSGDQLVWAGSYGSAIDLGGGKLPANASKTGSVFVAKHGNRSEKMPHRWSRGFAGDDTQLVTALAVDADGNVLITGIFTGTLDFGDGPSSAPNTGSSVFLVKLSP